MRLSPMRPCGAVAALTLCAILLAGCRGGGSESPAGPGVAPEPAEFKVGLLLAGSPDDGGWNSLAAQGLEQIRKQTGAHTSWQLTRKADMAQGFRDYARAGYRLVIGHGAEFAAAAEQVAPDYPKTYFVVSSGDVRGPNFNSIKFDIAQTAYLAGILAAGVSRSGVAGAIGGEKFEAVAQGFRAFEAGGKSYRPDFRVLTDYVGDWSNANKAKEQALAMIRQKADVLFQNADAAGRGVFLAAKENGALAIGSNADQNGIEPQVIIASAVLGVPEAFVEVARDVRTNHVRDTPYVEDLAGAAGVSVNPALASRIPPNVKQRMEAARRDILAGRLKLPAAGG